MHNMLKTMLPTLCAATAMFASAEAKWKPVATKNVNFASERDVIHCGDKGFVKGLSLGVNGNAVRFHKIEVHFLNGQREEWETRDIIPDGGRTIAKRFIGQRVVTKVVFHYKSVGPKNKKGKVTLWIDD